MSKPRVTATDRLANVIEVVELGQRTGLLAVERGSGSVLEEGELYFIAGRVMYASLAGLRGREALVALSRWGPCRFGFDPEALQPPPNLAPESPSGPRAAVRPGLSAETPGYRSPTPYESSGVWPMQSPSQISGPIGFPQSPHGPSSTSNGSGKGNGNGAPNGYRATGPLDLGTPSGYALRHQDSVPTSGNPTPTSPFTGASSPFNRRPRRAPDVRDLMTVMTTYNLTRSHRTVLLLADGEHTVLDLARLSSKSVDEVAALLGDLEARNLVYYYR
ncbi:MAG: DUF4388 domain-containing protein [Ktedonobacterales bacterium]